MDKIKHDNVLPHFQVCFVSASRSLRGLSLVKKCSQYIIGGRQRRAVHRRLKGRHVILYRSINTKSQVNVCSLLEAWISKCRIKRQHMSIYRSVETWHRGNFWFFHFDLFLSLALRSCKDEKQTFAASVSLQRLWPVKHELCLETMTFRCRVAL